MERKNNLKFYSVQIPAAWLMVLLQILFFLCVSVDFRKLLLKKLFFFCNLFWLNSLGFEPFDFSLS